MLLKAVEVLLVGVQQPTTTKSPTTTETTTTPTNPTNPTMSSTTFVSNSNNTEDITTSVRLEFGDNIVIISLTENPIQVLVARDSIVVDDHGDEVVVSQEVEEGEIVEGNSDGEMPALESAKVIPWGEGPRVEMSVEERAEWNAGGAHFKRRGLGGMLAKSLLRRRRRIPSSSTLSSGSRGNFS